MLTFLLLPALFGVLLSVGFVYQWQGTRRDAVRFPPPGRFIETPAGTFHLIEKHGPAGPTVILESGLAASSLSWSLVQDRIAEFAHVCSYDRAGFGWSSPARSPRTVQAVVEELRTVLESGGLSAPFVLVGHSYGGLIVRAFAHLYPALVAGLVLIDPVSTGHWAGCSEDDQGRLSRGIRLARRGATLARFGFIRLVLKLVIVGRSLVPKAVAQITAPGAVPFLGRLTREIQQLPRPLWPIVRSHWSRPMGFSAISAYLAALQENCRTAESTLYQCVVPTTVLSAATATSFELEERASWLKANDAGEHRKIPDCGHWIQAERPTAVVEAVREVFEQTKRTPPSPYVYKEV